MQNLKKALLQGGCAVALALGTLTTAHAQVGGSLGLGVVGKAGSGKSDFGFHGEAWIGAGGFGGYLAGGSNDGEAFGEFGAGARFMVGGNVGLGALLTFAAQDGEDSNKMFYAVKPTFEVGFGGLTFTTTMQIPVGKKERSVNNGYGNVELRDKPGTDTCSNPANPNARVCVPYLVGHENGKEENRFGVDLNAAYRLDLGGFYVTPQIGVGVYDRAQGKNLVRFHAGAVAGLGFGGGLAFEGGIHVKHDNKSTSADRDGKTQAVFSAGLTWHFGGQGANAPSDFVNRSFNRTPFNKGVVASTSLGKSFDERARLTDSNSGVIVDTVQFMDSTDANPYTRMANLPSNHVLVILGGANIAFGNNTANIMNKTNLYFVGGGSTVELVGQNGHTGTWLTPGTRPTITKTANAAFALNNSSNIIFKGFDVVGNATGDFFQFQNNSHFGRIEDVSVRNGAASAILVNGSHNVTVNNFRSTNTGTAPAISVTNSLNTTLSNVTLRDFGNNAVAINIINNSHGTKVINFDIDDSDNNYDTAVLIFNSNNVTIQHGKIANFDVHGIVVDGDSSDNVTLDDIEIRVHPTATNGHGIWLNNGPDEARITNIRAFGRGAANFRALQVNDGAVNIRVGNFHAENWENGFFLEAAMSTIIDLGGNTFTANGMQSACDGTVNVTGGLNVTTTNNGTVALCR